MTKEITKAKILQEMEDKLKLREFEPAKFLFDETVIPIYNIEQHLEKWHAKYVAKSVTTTGGLLFQTIPQNEKWTLWRYDVIFVASGAYTVAGVYVHRWGDSADQYCYVDLGAAKSASYHIELPIPLVLMPGDTVFINVDGYTSTASLRLYFDYMVEEIR